MQTLIIQYKTHYTALNTSNFTTLEKRDDGFIISTDGVQGEVCSVLNISTPGSDLHKWKAQDESQRLLSMSCSRPTVAEYYYMSDNIMDRIPAETEIIV